MHEVNALFIEDQEAYLTDGDTRALWHNYLMQYTWLKDKNNKEIYEGDILKKWDDIVFVYEVDWCFVVDDYIATWNYYTKKLYEFLNKDKDIPIDWEVIGNIHENPELLK